MRFYSPYQFIPVTGKVNGKNTHLENFTAIESTSGHGFIRHDRWMPNTHSGRLVCCLHTVSPILVGAEQKQGQGREPGSVDNYYVRGRLAIPGNSLRGMIGSVLEAISQSAMRVLEDKSYRVLLGSYPHQKPRDVDGSLYEVFSKSVGDYVLPWGATPRDGMTPAEVMLGGVEEQKQDNRDATRNLASRVRFHDAWLNSENPDSTLMERVRLKELGTPCGPSSASPTSRPSAPSPAMYFRTKTGGYVGKETLKLDNDSARPNGRKRYLPASTEEISYPRWKSALTANKRQLTGRPIRDKQNFDFHVDFENLSDSELTLLLASIDPRMFTENADDFVHKLGLGKPIGLGSVSVTVMGMFVIDRAARYSSTGLCTPRYTHWYGDAKAAEFMAERYETELEASTRASAAWPTWDRSLIDNETLNAVVLLGDRTKRDSGVPVCYPFDSTKSQSLYNESRSYQWFVSNNGWKQSLGPVTTAGGIPTLDSQQPDAVISPATSMSEPAQQKSLLPPVQNGVELYVGNLPLYVTEKDVRSLVETYANIGKFSLSSARPNNPKPRYAFVEVDETVAQEVIAALKGETIQGRSIAVSLRTIK